MKKFETLIEEAITVPTDDPDVSVLMDCIVATAKEADLVQLPWYEALQDNFRR